MDLISHNSTCYVLIYVPAKTPYISYLEPYLSLPTWPPVLARHPPPLHSRRASLVHLDKSMSRFGYWIMITQDQYCTRSNQSYALPGTWIIARQLLSNQVAGLQIPTTGACLKSLSPPLVKLPGIKPGSPNCQSSVVTTTLQLRSRGGRRHTISNFPIFSNCKLILSQI